MRIKAEVTAVEMKVDARGRPNPTNESLDRYDNLHPNVRKDGLRRWAEVRAWCAGATWRGIWSHLFH